VGSFRAGMRAQATSEVALRTAAYSGFRVPTLNELYRLFRVGNDITEANPALTPERAWGFDAAIEWVPTEAVRGEFIYFRSWLKNSVANITLRTTPGLDPLTGVVVPAGGVLRQRRNLPRAVSDGVEASASLDLASELTMSVRYLYADPEVTRSPDQPALIGARLAQVPRHQMTVGLNARLVEDIAARLDLRHVSRQFDDDLNVRPLGNATVVDARLAWTISESGELSLAAENLFNETVEAGRSADGLVSIGTPRTVVVGFRYRF
jgi:outer membrane receptor protein involved in Fe transport